MCFDDGKGPAAALAIPANAVRPIERQGCVRRQPHRFAILLNHLRVTTGGAELRPALSLSNSGQEIPTNVQPRGRHFRIKHDQIANHNW
jgi:hypothetical protein